MTERPDQSTGVAVPDSGPEAAPCSRSSSCRELFRIGAVTTIRPTAHMKKRRPT